MNHKIEIERAYTAQNEETGQRLATMAVAVVNYNTCQHLRLCLETVQAVTGNTSAQEVIVVDNDSIDGSAAMVREEYPWAALIENQANIGYGSAANQAIAACQAPYALLLNSDTRLQPGTLQALSAYLDDHPRAAIAGPRLANQDGSLQPSCYSFPTPLNVFLEESALARPIGLFPGLRNLYLRTWSHDQDRVVPWVLGAALAIRRDAFSSVGGFDPSYFLYAEEVDLCYRLRAAGWETHFTPRARITHIGGIHIRQVPADIAVQYFSSMVHFYKLHYPRNRLRQFVLIMKGMALARLLRDRLRLVLESEPTRRARFSNSISAWRRILEQRIEI